MTSSIRTRLGVVALAVTVGAFAAPNNAQAQPVSFGSSMGVECFDSGCSVLKFVLDVFGTPAINTNVFSMEFKNLATGTWTFADPSISGNVSVFDANGNPGAFSTTFAGGDVSILVSNGTPTLEPITVFVKMAGSGVTTDLAGAFDYGAEGYEFTGAPVFWKTVGTATVTPEPGTMLLLATGLAGLGFVGSKRRKLDFEDDQEA